MIPYLLSWLLFAVNGLGGARRIATNTTLFLGVFLTILIGLREEIGSDWFNYLPYLDRYTLLTLAEVFLEKEPGYGLLNWIGGNWGGGIYFVNTACALIFSVGLLSFCKAQPRPWLALTLAFPYLVTVVAMGYSRQGVAIGFELIALLALQRDRLFRYLGWIILAASFHRTALVLLVLPAATLSRKFRFSQLVRLGLLAGAGYGLYSSIIEPNIDYYTYIYLDREYGSQGALIRVLLCLAPALIFLPNRRSFSLDSKANRIWTLTSILALVLFVALFLSPSSTAVDRLALYLIPLQLFVGSRLPDTRLWGLSAALWKNLLVLLSLAVLLTWLLYANHATDWLPYLNILSF